jgi:hypothetical protein
MPQRLLFLLICVLVASTTLAVAETEEKNFNLLHTTLEEQAAQRQEVQAEEIDYDPIVTERSLETTLTLGYWMIDKVLLQHENLIYKYTDENTYFGDVTIKGQSAFNPQLHLNYNLFPWFSLESVLGISVSEYLASIRHPRALANTTSGEEGALVDVESIGEFDAENRSCITMSTGLNGIFYPSDYGNFGRGRWHPFVTGGVQRTWVSLNSDYIDDMATAWDLQGGLGVRYVADDMISIRFEILYHHMTLDFTPSTEFLSLDEDTRKIPVYEYIDGSGTREVTDFAAQTLNTMSWALGFTATF